MLISRNLPKVGSEISIKRRSTPASLSFKGQPTKHTIVKWSTRRLHGTRPVTVTVTVSPAGKESQCGYKLTRLLFKLAANVDDTSTRVNERNFGSTLRARRQRFSTVTGSTLTRFIFTSCDETEKSCDPA